MISVAIDGPSGAGKSSLAKRLAADMGFTYVDTGAMYRSIGLYAVRQGKDLSLIHIWYRNPTLSSILATQMPCRSCRSGA